LNYKGISSLLSSIKTFSHSRVENNIFLKTKAFYYLFKWVEKKFSGYPTILVWKTPHT
jgi:hypothetical protein